MSAFSLFTSICPPQNPEALSYLRECLGSWKTAGFDIVAVNGPTECAAMEPLKLPVMWHRLPRDGKPLIGNILAAIRSRPVGFAGIINADCQLIAYPDLAENLARNLSGRAAFAHRFDSDNGALKPMLWGFDAFFFDTALLPSSDLGFAIGDPWWDIWFPMSFEIAGVPIETIDTPLVIHRIHPIRWNWLRWIANGNQFWAWLQEHKTTPLFGKIEPAWREQRRLSREQLGEVNRMIVAWLRDHRPQTDISVMPAAMGTVESMLRLGGRATVETAYTRQIETVETAYTRQIEKELDAIKRSTFWRATGPLRTTVTVFRKISAAARRAVA
jgi:hypothetical protein